MNAPGSFWAQRKAGVLAETQADDLVETVKTEEEERATIDAKSDAEILEMLKLPDPDTLGAGDDFSVFMAKAVPHRLRNRALRKLWPSNPVLACLDGLNDYDDDYLTGTVGAGAIKTAYQVGKGMLAHLEAVERQKAAAEDENAQPTEADPVISMAQDTEVSEQMAENPAVEFEGFNDGDVTETFRPNASPRRMQFHFAGETA